MSVSPNATLTLLGWVVQPPAVDAGVPDVVARLLSEVLAPLVVVSFFTGTAHQGVFARLFSRDRNEASVVVHTCDSQTVRRLFDDPRFAWSTRAQAAFLSPLGARPPSLHIADLDDALAGHNFEQLRERGITGLLVPGVDGDVAGCYVFDYGLSTSLHLGLRDATHRLHVECREVTEPDFERAIARHT